MFTADEFQLIRSHCLPDLEKFLKQISVPIPNWNSGDEFRIYDKVGGEITNKMCRLLKSNSVVEGYTKLLKLGNISYDFSETDNELLEKIISNKEKIFQCGMNEKNLQPIQKPIDNFEIKISHAEKFSVTDLLEKISRLEILLENSHERLKVKTNQIRSETREYPKNFRAMKNEITELRDYVKNLELVEVKKFSTTVPLENLTGTIQEYSSAFVEVKKFFQPVRQPEPPKIIFTEIELKEIFEVLEQVNKINKFI